LIGLAEGRIPVGDYSVHVHFSLEQVTYVVSGQLRVRMGSPDEELSLGPGEAVFTEPGRTLSFHNAGPLEASVLFICVPPYPADDSDTGLPGAHGSLPGSDLQRAVRRQRAALEAISRLFAARAERLREQGRHAR
jgi:hypothetical protein